MFIGRQLDVTSILLYAEENVEFDRYAMRLEARPGYFSFIPPKKRIARTDVTAFILRLYADLGIAPVSEAENAEKLVDEYGAGLVVRKK